MPKHDAAPQDARILASLIEQYGSVSATARALGIPRSTLRNRIASSGLTVEVKPNGPVTINQTPRRSPERDPSVESGDPAEWSDITALLQSRNMNPKEWIVKSARVNEWGTPDNLSRQLRLDLLPTMLIPHPVSKPMGWTPPTPGSGDRVTDGLVFIAGDHHEPFKDEQLHEGVLAWLKEFKPERGLIIGDLLDYDRVSRHPSNPTFTADLNTTLESAWETLCSYRAASPATKWTMLDGNHEDRLRNAILKQLPALHDLRYPGQSEDAAPVLSTRSLLRLDELGIDFQTAPHGPYSTAQVSITDKLVTRHGWISKKGSGASALATIDTLRYSVIIGHTHRQSIVYHTAHSIDGTPIRLLGAEAGTLARIQGGLGYVASGAPDWQQGFATATIHDKDTGHFSVDLAVYAGKHLLWRDWHYKP